MRIFILTLAIMAWFTLPALAEPNIKQLIPFSNASSASAAVRTSSVINVAKFKNKTLVVNGMTRAGVFKTMSGTVIAQCGPTSNGPWSTCIANDYAQTAISRTTNGLFSWSDVSSYVRLQWTGSTVETWMRAWLNLSE